LALQEASFYGHTLLAQDLVASGADSRLVAVAMQRKGQSSPVKLDDKGRQARRTVF